jgi:tetratricopeptide (TPR) repeat protein
MDITAIRRAVRPTVLEDLLRTPGEHNQWDFKQTLDLAQAKDRAEVARDIMAFANSEGGHIIFGVADKPFDPIGLPDSVKLDTTTLCNAAGKWISEDLHLLLVTHEISLEGWSTPRRFGLLYIPPAERLPVVPAAPASYPKPGGKTEHAFSEGDIYVRRGSATRKAGPAEFGRFFRSTSPEQEGTRTQRQPLVSMPSSSEIAIEFVGRAKELEELATWLTENRSNYWLLTGEGGKGKSAIAFEFATRIAHECPEELEAIIWLSAKRHRFLDGKMVEVAEPDFIDLSSLLNELARAYGFVKFIGLPVEERRTEVFDLLKELPALIVADDIDSLAHSSEDAIAFLQSVATRTNTKVLFTSRRVPFGMGAMLTQVTGLDVNDAELFIESRVRLFRMSTEQVTTHAKQQMVTVTEASPLFLEDILRLSASIGVKLAIQAWQGKMGEQAREYAIKREFEMLSPQARSIVLCCCLVGRPISITEIAQITGFPEDAVIIEMSGIHDLFLISGPQLLQGIDRFSVNSNTRALVVRCFEGTQEMCRISRAVQAVDGRPRQALVDSNAVNAYLRQAQALAKARRFVEAVSTLQAGLEEYPDHPDILSDLGILLTEHVPPRMTDARQVFSRAAQLNCRRESMYQRWSSAESALMEWRLAAEAAEIGIRKAGRTVRLLLAAGYARSRLGQELKRAWQTERASQELKRAEEHLREALTLSLHPDDCDFLTQSRAFRALVLNHEARDNQDAMADLLTRWRKHLPNDRDMQYEYERLAYKYPGRVAAEATS